MTPGLRLLRFLIWGATVAATACAFAWVYSSIIAFGIELPFYDEWQYLEVILASPDALRATAFAFHGDHWIVTTNLTFAALIAWTHLSHRVGFLLNLSLATATLVVVLGAWYRSAPTAIRDRSWFPALAPFLLLSVQQYENWTWAFEVQWYFTILFSVSALVLLGLGRSARSETMAVAMGLLAMASSAGGMLVWPAMLALLVGSWWCGVPRPRAFVAVLLSLAVSWVIYHYGSVTTPAGGHAVSLLEGLLTWLAVIGAPVCNYSARTAPWIGALGLAGAMLASSRWLVTIRSCDALPWLALLVYALLATAAIAYGRAAFGGVQYAIDSSRYTTVSGLFWIALLALSALLLSSPRAYLLKVPCVALLIYCYSYSTQLSVRWWTHRHNIMSAAQHALLTYDPTLLTLEEPSTAIRHIGLIREPTLEALRRQRLSLFWSAGIRGTMHETSPGESVGSIDWADVRSENAVELLGWAADPFRPSRPAQSVMIRHGAQILGYAPVGSEREDVGGRAIPPRRRPFRWRYVVDASLMKDPCALHFFSVAADHQTVAVLHDDAPAFAACH